ncbi:DUF488 domain-containing protein [Halorubellus sp. PRR65]|uniref:DUF488 domain-containing protein n=1 Tax=Halorubellus sp. PRR65 TaxID=3098148 RepID=UPI002B25BFC5|nr:DUF488 domain-containing protein [Halorubellus sp. PRR65]
MTDDATDSTGRGRVLDTYVAALQHDLADVGDATRVGVVRRPTRWFSGSVDENEPALAPPETLLDETKQRQEDFEMRGVCEREAHNEAWLETDFAARYRAHLESDADAAVALESLAERVRDGEPVALVCFENTDTKRCHRTILRDVIESRLAADDD